MLYYTNNKQYNNEYKNRKNKLNNLRNQGHTFPNNFRREYISSDLHKKYDDKDNKILTELNIIISIAGRLITKRIMGKASFATIQDMSGYIQVYISRNQLSSYDIYEKLFKKLDLGDIIGIKGKLFKTKTNELTINCYEIHLLTKTLRPLPDKFHGLIDKETRYRQRYLDLITNDISRKNFMTRSHVIACIRNFMLNKNFIEVETPMLQVIPGGANAKPFITHHNTLNIDMYLRIAPELYLKRLIIGGFEQVFEINRNFRNEGISPWHNPEFTMMEVYIAYADYTDLMILIEELFRTILNKIIGTTRIQYGNYLLDFSKSFKILSMKQSIIKYLTNINIHDLDNLDNIKNITKLLNINIKQNWGVGRIQYEIFEMFIVKNLIQPTYITEYPIEISPLARRNDKNPLITDRFELFICGNEIANGFSELNDSEEQAERFKTKLLQQKHNNDEIMYYDEDYILALEHGLPPTAGLGIGIDRIIMLLTNSQTIRDVILFPILRPNK